MLSPAKDFLVAVVRQTAESAVVRYCPDCRDWIVLILDSANPVLKQMGALECQVAGGEAFYLIAVNKLHQLLALAGHKDNGTIHNNRLDVLTANLFLQLNINLSRRDVLAGVIALYAVDSPGSPDNQTGL